MYIIAKEYTVLCLDQNSRHNLLIKELNHSVWFLAQTLEIERTNKHPGITLQNETMLGFLV